VHEPMEKELGKRIRSELGSLSRQSQLRVLGISSGVDFCSNDYLGLASDRRLKLALLKAIACTDRVGSTGSRLLSGNHRAWENLEAEFSQFACTQAALYFGSGYAANVGLLSSILRPGDTAFSDSLNHASLIDGIRLSSAYKYVYPHGDMDALERGLRDRKTAAGAKVIVTESVFSMEGDIAPLDRLVRLAKDYGADIVVDEAHSTGVWGPEGRGIVVERGYEREVLAVVHTCGKALASAGAFVCSERTLKQCLVNRARTFIYSTALPPYFAAQVHEAMDLARKADSERAQIARVAEALRESLIAARIDYGLSETQIVPILLGSNEEAMRVAARLAETGFTAKAIRPPTVPFGKARIRLSLTSRTSLVDVRRLVGELVRAVRFRTEPPSATRAHA